MGPPWGHLGGILGQLGAILAQLMPSGTILGHLGAILEPSSVDLGAILGSSPAILGNLGAILRHLGPSWGHRGAILGHLGTSLGHLGAVAGHLWPSLACWAATHLFFLSLAVSFSSAGAAQQSPTVQSVPPLSASSSGFLKCYVFLLCCSCAFLRLFMVSVLCLVLFVWFCFLCFLCVFCVFLFFCVFLDHLRAIFDLGVDLQTSKR